MTEEEYYNEQYVNRLRKYLPASCRKCSLLKVINAREMKVYCPYRIKDKCIMKGK